MDRQIKQKEINKQKNKRYIKWIIFILIAILAYWGVTKLLQSSADADQLVLATVEKGNIENRISAFGTVVPYYERNINAPVSTEIKEVLLKPGDIVEKGDLIMELDQEFTRLEYESLKDELQLKKNNIVKLKLEYDKDLNDLDYRSKIKGLEVEQLTAGVTDQKRLQKIGGATAEEVEQSELRLKVAKLEKGMLENELNFKKAVNDTDKENLELELKIQEKKLRELYRKLNETSVKSPNAGVITWLNESLGKKIQEGELIAKIANLDRFKVEATAADRNTDKITLGTMVRVRINNQIVNGIINNISPSIENNTVKFEVTLEESDVDLRANMRVEVFIITEQQLDVLKLKNGGNFKGAQRQSLYQVIEGVAYKKSVEIGLRNSDNVEIKGVKEGDQFIISSTEEFDHLEQFKIND